MIYFELFWTFFKIGLFTFGGGYAMLPLIQKEVAAHNWISSDELVNFVAVSESTPGPFAVNMATYIGSEMGGTSGDFGVLGSIFGSFCATLGVVLPSFIIILIVAKCYEKFQSSKIVKGCMSGLKPAVIGLIGSAVVSIASTVLFPAGISLSVFTGLAFYISVVIFLIMAILSFKKVHPILIILMSAVIGISVGYGFDLQL